MGYKNNIPRHIAIIMDGNGRWAKEKGLPRVAGHRAGVQRVREIIRAASELGIEVITFFAFSTENWSRPAGEIRVLMGYLEKFLDRQVQELDKSNMRVKIIGSGAPLPQHIQKKIKDSEDKTKDNTGMIVVFAINYGSRQEIVDAAKKFAYSVLEKKANPEDLDVESFKGYFYTAGLPDPDLLIRTSGEMRISNFLLWQLSYAECYFPKKYWPDFKKEDLEKALEVYRTRERRFGRIDVEQENN